MVLWQITLISVTVDTIMPKSHLGDAHSASQPPAETAQRKFLPSPVRIRALYDDKKHPSS
jgi:hypothetical protein